MEHIGTERNWGKKKLSKRNLTFAPLENNQLMRFEFMTHLLYFLLLCILSRIPCYNTWATHSKTFQRPKYTSTRQNFADFIYRTVKTHRPSPDGDRMKFTCAKFKTADQTIPEVVLYSRSGKTAWTACNQFHLPKNGRESLKLVTTMAQWRNSLSSRRQKGRQGKGIKRKRKGEGNWRVTGHVAPVINWLELIGG